ncbi:hypothetical protein [Rhodopseudomonas palustris]|uniref:hypothetical protein n=1 Tax=Rhodopseudomonas palustris TaxID=1076 RepID=UPI0021F31C21|nr:hypothetical protein [Rhodopseudomonas palustris]UYO55196.1 hypothetical protein KQX61_07275 [Rhodopseudomonas palustris]
MRHESIHRSKSVSKIPPATAGEMIAEIERLGTASAAARSLRTSLPVVYAALGTDATKRYGAQRTTMVWDDANIDRLIALVDRGLSNGEIAVEMGSTTLAVQKAMVAHGVRRLGDTRGARVRECLCCDRRFHSSGIGNRLCPACTTDEDHDVSVVGAGVRVLGVRYA